MSEIPAQPPAVPMGAEEAYEELAAWYLKNTALSELKVSEVLKRKKLASFYFPQPQEGVTRLPIGWDRDLMLEYSITRNVDEPALLAQQEDLIAAGIDIDELFDWAPRLCLTPYRALSEEKRKLVDSVLDIKLDTTPRLSIVPHSEEKREYPAQTVAVGEAPKKRGRKKKGETAAPLQGIEHPTNRNVGEDIEPFLMTEKAGKYTYGQFIAKGWTHEEMIKDGYCVPNPAMPPLMPEREEVSPAPLAEAYTMTPKAEGYTVAQLLAIGWTIDALVNDGYAIPLLVDNDPMGTAAPSPPLPPAPPVPIQPITLYQMTPKAEGWTREALVATGAWTDETLLAEGLMVAKQASAVIPVTSRPPPPGTPATTPPAAAAKPKGTRKPRSDKGKSRK